MGSREEEDNRVSLTPGSELNDIEMEGWKLMGSPTAEESHEQ